MVFLSLITHRHAQQYLYVYFRPMVTGLLSIESKVQVHLTAIIVHYVKNGMQPPLVSPIPDKVAHRYGIFCFVKNIIS